MLADASRARFDAIVAVDVDRLLRTITDLVAVMERMGHSQIMTTQKYLHTLPDADDKALAAFESVRNRASASLLRR